MTASLPTVESCEGCGVCCMHMGYPAYLIDSEHQPDEPYWVNLPADLKQELMGFIARYSPPKAGQLDGPCCWLDMKTRKCKHHQYRPRVCRDFTVGGSGCRQWREQLSDKIRT